MKYDVVVLGAGIVGLTTAFYLNKHGYRVAVIDRHDKSGEETSYANGGQISVSHAEPWANPSAPLQVLKWLTKSDSPLYFKPKLDMHQWIWLISWLNNCRPSKCDFNTASLTKLALESLDEFKKIRHILKFKYDLLECGILHIYYNANSYAQASHSAGIMSQEGLDIKLLNAYDVCKLEPSLEPHVDRLVGGTFSPQDESGDCYKFCQEMSYYLSEKGVKFFFNTGVVKAHGTKYLTSAVQCVDMNDQDRYFSFDIQGSKFVVCMGSFSYQFVRANYNRTLNIYPAKGSSITVPIINSEQAPTISVTDDTYKIVYTRLGNRLRVAGTAELTGWNTNINVDRCKAVLARARELFPHGCDYNEVEMWSGLRPATPSNLPYVKKLEDVHNVYLNTGHGTLGWTLSCGSAKRIADIIFNS